MEGHSSTRLELLNDSNYFTWKYRMEMQLTRKDLWSIVDGSEPRPVTGTARQNAWDKRARLASAEIILNVSDSQLPHTRKSNSPIEIWNVLKEAHESSGWANRMTLLRQFVSLKKENDDTPSLPPSGMQKHINKFNQIDESLKSIGITLDDTLRMTILLASLPASYESVVSAIESYIEAKLNAPPTTRNHGTTIYPPAPSPGPNFAYVTRRLLNEERKRILDWQQTHGVMDITDDPKTTHYNDHAMAAQSRRPPLNSITCYHCHKKGHYRNNCSDLARGGATISAVALNNIEPDFAF